MKLAAYNRFCGALPHTLHVVQWGGAHVWKVGGKVFAIGVRLGDGDVAVSFKCSRTSFEMLADAPGMRPAPYLASRGAAWLQRVDGSGLTTREFRKYLRESYRLVGLGLPKKLRVELGLEPQPGGAPAHGQRGERDLVSSPRTQSARALLGACAVASNAKRDPP